MSDVLLFIYLSYMSLLPIEILLLICSINYNDQCFFSLLPGFSCDQCGKTFTQKVNLDRHKSIKHGNPPPQFQCDQCTASFNCKDSLKRHRQGHVIQGRCEPSCRAVTLDPLITNIVVKEPFSASRLVSFDNSSTAYRSRGQSLLMTEASPGQSSSSSSCNTPQVETSVHFRTHEQHPLTSGISSSHSTTKRTITYQQIRNHLEQILRSEGQAFKINMAFGLVLRDIVSSEFTFFHPIKSDGVIERPILITNQRDIDKFMEMLKNLNILEHLTKQRPNTRKVFHSVTNVMFYINRTEYVLGTADDLPDYGRTKGP